MACDLAAALSGASAAGRGPLSAVARSKLVLQDFCKIGGVININGGVIYHRVVLRSNYWALSYKHTTEYGVLQGLVVAKEAYCTIVCGTERGTRRVYDWHTCSVVKILTTSARTQPLQAFTPN
jgi:hypothetical protein